ncbi:MAG: sensor histidine kinase [bacterium]
MSPRNEQEELESRKTRDQFRNLSAYLQAAREEERKSIASEIHDELGQVLTTLKLDLSLLREEMLHDVVAAGWRIQRMNDAVDDTIHDVKRIISKLRPILLDDLGLSAAMEWQANEFQQHTGIVCEIFIDPEEMRVDDDRSTAVFRIFQETLTNVGRHAGATRVSASLIKTDELLELQVRDNGRGITQEQLHDPKSFGLFGIHERARYWGGEAEIKGVPKAGTTVTVRFPLDTSEAVL